MSLHLPWLCSVMPIKNKRFLKPTPLYASRQDQCMPALSFARLPVDCDNTAFQGCQICWRLYLEDTLHKVHQLKFFELQLRTDNTILFVFNSHIGNWRITKRSNIMVFLILKINYPIFVTISLTSLSNQSSTKQFEAVAAGDRSLGYARLAFYRWFSLIFAHSRENQRKYARKRNYCIHFRAIARKSAIKWGAHTLFTGQEPPLMISHHTVASLSDIH